MTDELINLLNLAKKAKPTPEEQEEQRRSFAYGNTHFENEKITREIVNGAAEDLKKQNGSKVRSV